MFKEQSLLTCLFQAISKIFVGGDKKNTALGHTMNFGSPFCLPEDLNSDICEILQNVLSLDKAGRQSGRRRFAPQVWEQWLVSEGHGWMDAVGGPQ